MAPFSGDLTLPDHTEHRQAAAGPGWSEHHRLVAIHDDESAALAMSAAIRTTTGHDAASFHCVVFRNDEPPIVIIESDIVAPDRLWELRTSGLWADTICETPYLHWSYGLEAFGLAIDDPVEMLGRGYGDRVPLGWELEFESDRGQGKQHRPPTRSEATEARGAITQTGVAHGILLFAAGQEQAFSGRSLRQHWWGETSMAPLVELDQLVAELDGPPGTGALATDGPITQVAMPLPGEQGQWWLTRTNSGLRSETRCVG